MVSNKKLFVLFVNVAMDFNKCIDVNVVNKLGDLMIYFKIINCGSVLPISLWPANRQGVALKLHSGSEVSLISYYYIILNSKAE